MQMALLYGLERSPEERAEAKPQCRKQLQSIALIEALVTNPDGQSSIDDFGQPGSDQAAHLGTWLSSDDSKSLENLRPAEVDTFRVAFFLHYFDPGKPLNTSYGPVSCPRIEEMPDRLVRLVAFEPVD